MSRGRTRFFPEGVRSSSVSAPERLPFALRWFWSVLFRARQVVPGVGVKPQAVAHVHLEGVDMKPLLPDLWDFLGLSTTRFFSKCIDTELRVS